MKNSLEEQNKSIVRKYWDGKWNEKRPEILDELHLELTNRPMLLILLLFLQTIGFAQNSSSESKFIHPNSKLKF